MSSQLDTSALDIYVDGMNLDDITFRVYGFKNIFSKFVN
jgi:hypothetical protein